MKPRIYVVGYQPRPGCPLDDYTDFPIGRAFDFSEIDTMTDMGVLPPGLMLMARGGYPCIVRGPYDTVQSVEPVRVG